MAGSDPQYGRASRITAWHRGRAGTAPAAAPPTPDPDEPARGRPLAGLRVGWGGLRGEGALRCASP
ncbi:hypothetical protein [Thermaerobacter litoralis]